MGLGGSFRRLFFPGFLFFSVFSLFCWAEEPHIAGERLEVVQKVVIPEPELSLEQILEIGLMRNPTIEASRQDMTAYRSKVTQAKSAYMPQFSSAAAYKRQYFESPAEAVAMGGTSREFNDYSANFAVSQFLYGFGKNVGRIKQSRQNYIASEEALSKTVADIVWELKKAYYEVLKKKQLMKVSEESVRTQEKHLEQARAKFEAGTRPRIDVTKSEVGLAQSRLKYIEATYALRLARVELESLLGGTPVEGPYRLAEVKVLPVLDEDLDRLISEALLLRPELEQLAALAKAAQAQLQSARGGYFPSLSAGGSYGWESTEFPLNSAWMVGVNMNWELFPGLKTYGEVGEAKANRTKLQAQMRQVELQVIQDVSQAFLQSNQAVESIKTAGMALEQAQENMELAQGRYRTGVGDAIEFSDAELSLTQAKSDLVQATYDYLEARADLDHAVGRQDGTPLFVPCPEAGNDASVSDPQTQSTSGSGPG